jgi:hypothetical protein
VYFLYSSQCGNRPDVGETLCGTCDTAVAQAGRIGPHRTRHD